MGRSQEYSIQAGDLKHPLYVQDHTDTRDAIGGVIRTWADRAQFTWGSVRPLTARELSQADTIDAVLTHRIQIRSVSPLDTTNRIRFGTRIFNIGGIRDIDEIGKTLVIMATEDPNKAAI